MRIFSSQRIALPFLLRLLNDQIDRPGEPVPVCSFLVQLLPASRRQ